MTVKYFEEINLTKMKNFKYYSLMLKIANCIKNDNPLDGAFANLQAVFMADFTRLAKKGWHPRLDASPDDYFSRL